MEQYTLMLTKRRNENHKNWIMRMFNQKCHHEVHQNTKPNSLHAVAANKLIQCKNSDPAMRKKFFELGLP